MEVAEPTVRPGLKILLASVALAGCITLYTKYQTQQETARLERARIAEQARQEEIAKQKIREEKWAASEAEREQQAREFQERITREHDLMHGRQVTRNLRASEQQIKYEKERANLALTIQEQQRLNENAQQLAREKAYLRQLEAENSRSRRGF